MRTDNEQHPKQTKQTASRNGAASDDKSKDGDSAAAEEVGGREPRGGSSIDDRAKQFGPLDHPKA